MHGNVHIPYTNYPENLLGYFARGYFNAAKSLTSNLLKERFLNCDAYPAIFLYRMSLELYLKSAIYLGRQRLCYEKDIVTGHVFDKILNDFTPVFTEVFPDNDDLLNSIKEACAFFESNDPKSFSYRYPTDTKGNRPTPEEQIINLHDLCALLNPVLEDLDTIYFGLSNELSS